MDKEISSALGRLDRYLFRVKRAVRNGELALALSDTAELAELSRRTAAATNPEDLDFAPGTPER
jgi:hypothetical protein